MGTRTGHESQPQASNGDLDKDNDSTSTGSFPYRHLSDHELANLLLVCRRMNEMDRGPADPPAHENQSQTSTGELDGGYDDDFPASSNDLDDESESLASLEDLDLRPDRATNSAVALEENHRCIQAAPAFEKQKSQSRKNKLASVRRQPMRLAKREHMNYNQVKIDYSLGT